MVALDLVNRSPWKGSTRMEGDNTNTYWQFLTLKAFL